MSKMSEVPAVLIIIDPADSQIQSSLLELEGKLHVLLDDFLRQVERILKERGAL
jgi:hypothetical protein